MNLIKWFINFFRTPTDDLLDQLYEDFNDPSLDEDEQADIAALILDAEYMKRHGF